ncbi:MAG: T9SS type A sorting domain-containing protein [Candidatus Cloacimonetes bacterium]|nr:T9SS type A sorting domain-containing protein [Candidatus Cloacimonadota bacterium]
MGAMSVCAVDVDNDGDIDVLSASHADDKIAWYENLQITSSEENNNLIQKSYLLANYPNPFNPSTTISFSILEDSKVELSIFNLKGQNVNTIVNDNLQKGEHLFSWNGTDKLGEILSSGVYFYKLNINGRVEVIKKCMLLK